MYGKGTGFTGVATIAEGQTWTETHASYDGQIHEGAFFNEDHSGVQIKVDDFSVKYRANGAPESFDTKAELFHADGTSAGTADISLNHPASIDGVKFYQVAYGFAPVITITKDGKPLTSEPVIFTRTPPGAPGVDPNSLPWHGVVRLPTLDPQMVVDFYLWPDSQALAQFIQTGKSFPMLQPNAPILTFNVYEGDLASQPAGSNEINTKALQPVNLGDTRLAVAVGDTQTLPDGLAISFPELRQYTQLQVSRDRGTMIMLLAALLILAGLIPALYTSRRRVWVRAEARASGTALVVGGFALQRRVQFEEEFARLVNALADDEKERRKVPSS
jgi:cytochrome c biogenesis protein ResB